MILTCPDCATSYFVEDGRIPPRGRTVKCSNCGARWRATPDGEVEREEARRDFDDLVAVPSAAAPPPEDDLEFVAAPVTPVRKPPPARKRPLGLMIGAGVVAVLIALAGAGAVLRGTIVQMVPSTAPLFAAVGLPVHALGLVIEDQTWKMDFVAGRPVISITGSIRNITKAAVTAPPIRAEVLNRKNEVLVRHNLMLTNARVPPGARRYFAWNLPEPPAEVSAVDLIFDPHATGAAALAEVPPPAAASSTPTPPEPATKHE
jgi:predicted Zn finger-like uncharacterized protein